VLPCDTWAETTPVKTLGSLGSAIGRRRRYLKLTQQHVSFVTGVAPGAVSRLELGRDDTTEFRVVLLVTNALGLDIELRPRGEVHAPPRRRKSTNLL
jgi:transcriptional regulator with XRE-family HTH domain